MTDSEILIVEISGKRPGTSKQRPTEKFQTRFDHLIISNNSAGYDSTWDIVDVPDDYRQFYIENYKISDKAYFAPMNRSYAIKYARERGYKYLIQLDDNIETIELAYKVGNKMFRNHGANMFDDFVEMLVCILENSNACMSGMRLQSMMPQSQFLSERYLYSFFALKLKDCPDVFHGDFEDDIEYRLKCTEKGLPTLMCVPLAYGKTSQVSGKDESGNRAAYTEAGLKRGETMRKIHGDVYKCGLKGTTASTVPTHGVFFRHQLKPIKVGTILYDKQAIVDRFQQLLTKYKKVRPDKIIEKKTPKRKG